MRHSTYHPLAKFLHWSVVILVALQFVTSWLMPEIRRNASPEFFVNIHMSFGLLVLPIALLLLLMRFVHPVEKVGVVSSWQSRSAIFMHYALYTLLLLLPLSGWTFASARGWDVSIFGLFTLPHLAFASSSIGLLFGEAHGLFASLIGILVVGHAGAALYHHFILKDSVLKRLLPAGDSSKDI